MKNARVAITQLRFAIGNSESDVSIKYEMPAPSDVSQRLGIHNFLTGYSCIRLRPSCLVTAAEHHRVITVESDHAVLSPRQDEVRLTHSPDIRKPSVNRSDSLRCDLALSYRRSCQCTERITSGEICAKQGRILAQL